MKLIDTLKDKGYRIKTEIQDAYDSWKVGIEHRNSEAVEDGKKASKYEGVPELAEQYGQIYLGEKKFNRWITGTATAGYIMGATLLLKGCAGCAIDTTNHPPIEHVIQEHKKKHIERLQNDIKDLEESVNYFLAQNNDTDKISLSSIYARLEGKKKVLDLLPEVKETEEYFAKQNTDFEKNMGRGTGIIVGAIFCQLLGYPASKKIRNGRKRFAKYMHARSKI